jgi:hypothetical protein
LQAVRDELLDFATALADQGDHVDVRRGAAREHAEKRALAAACRSEDSESLTLADRQQRVDDAHAGLEGLVNG